MEVRDDVLKSLEAARNEKLIGAPLEARVRLSANGDLYPLLTEYARELPGPVHRLAGGAGTCRRPISCAVAIERAAGRKCERCWKYTTDVGADMKIPHHLRPLRRCRGREPQWVTPKG